jgi:hypothetical protein
MNVVEDTLGVSIREFLERPLFSFLAQASDAGPRVSPLWFHWEPATEQMWHIAQMEGRSYPQRVQDDPRTAVAVVDFDAATGKVEHVGMRGRASIEPYDGERVRALLEKYLGTESTGWPDRFADLDAESYRLLRFEPETAVARDQSYDAPPNPGSR